MDEIEKEILAWSERERAALAARLLQSLGPVCGDHEEGLAEAIRRDAEMEADPTQSMSLEKLNSFIKDRHS